MGAGAGSGSGAGAGAGSGAGAGAGTETVSLSTCCLERFRLVDPFFLVEGRRGLGLKR